MTVVLVVLVVIAAWVAFLYVAPFGSCPRCRGAGRIMRGGKKKPHPVQCPRCKGARRRQRPGSRTVHQLARRIRRETHRQRQQRATPTAQPKE
jgi:DnaJ-class molecular chaperone